MERTKLLKALTETGKFLGSSGKGDRFPNDRLFIVGGSFLGYLMNGHAYKKPFVLDDFLSDVPLEVNLSHFKKLISKIKAPDVHLKLLDGSVDDDLRLVVSWVGGSANMAISLAGERFGEQFDPVEGIGTNELFETEIPVDFMDKLAWVGKAGLDDPLRLFMNVVFLEKSVMVATDGKRLHMDDSGIDIPDTIEDGLLIGLDQVRTMLSVKKNITGMKVCSRETKGMYDVKFIYEDGSIFSVCTVEGRFPNYNRVIPEIESLSSVALLLGFYEQVKEMRGFIDKASPIFVQLDAGRLLLSNTFPAQKEVPDTVFQLIEKMDYPDYAEGVNFACNGDYLMDGFSGFMFPNKLGGVLASPVTLFKSMDEPNATIVFSFGSRTFVVAPLNVVG